MKRINIYMSIIMFCLGYLITRSLLRFDYEVAAFSIIALIGVGLYQSAVNNFYRDELQDVKKVLLKKAFRNNG